MKKNARVKYITISMIALISIGILIKFLYYDRPKQDMINTSTNQAIQELAEKSKSSHLTASNKFISKPKLMEKLSKASNMTEDKQIKEAIAGSDSLNIDSQEEKFKKETSVELYQRWLRTTNSPEFQYNHQRYMDSLFTDNPITYLDKVKELENREKELENNLISASDEQKVEIRRELENIGAELWEARIKASERLTLQADAIWAFHLKYFTNNELLTVRKEIGRTASPFPSNPNRNRDERVKAEAMARLKARGWVPASPDESWY